MIEASIEKKGSNQAFAYTLILIIERKNTQIHKKRSISASEFITLKSRRKADMAELNCTRVCTMDGELYLLIDYYAQI